jgi:ABC-type transport system involved in multi-copper enzyme maturation permease subunit
VVKIAHVALVTFREALRRKVQVSLVVFGSFLILASFLVSRLTLGYQHRILADLGLSAMSLVGCLLAVFVGATLVAGDIERRVLYGILAKPASRTEYLLGRYAGLALLLLVNLAVMAAVLALVLVVEAGGLRDLDRPLLAAFGMMGVQFLVVGAIAILFSSITSSTLAAILGLSVVVAGHLTNEMRALWQDEGTRWLAKAIWYAVPNLGALSLNEAVIYRTPVPADAWSAALYAVLYSAAALAIASVGFERRDLK